MLPKHLALLQAMFPGVLMLNIDQIASLTKYGRGHLYNLSSEGRLPFKVSRDVGNKILVSIVELAAYLDKTMLSEYDVPVVPPPELVVKKRGRPRGSTNRSNVAQQGFQSEWRAAVYRAQANDLFCGLGRAIGELSMDGLDPMSCEQKFQKIQRQMVEAVGQAQEQYDQVDRRIAASEPVLVPQESRLFPFLLDADRLVLATPLDVAQVVNAEGVLSSFEVCWMTWEVALASVWRDEDRRLRWFAKMETVIVGLGDRVIARRTAVLALV